MKHFKENYRKLYESDLCFITKFQPLIHDKRTISILKLIACIRAYDFGIFMQAQKDYKIRVLENKTPQTFVLTDDYAKYNKAEVRRTMTQEQVAFRSSFENERSEKIKELNIGRIVSKIKQEDTNTSLDDDFKGFLLTKYKKRHIAQAKKIARKIIQEKVFKLEELPALAYKEVLFLSNKTYQNKARQLLAKSMVGYLERGITRHFPLLLKDLNANFKAPLLIHLRKESKNRYNTMCQRCGKKLKKITDRTVCTREENRSCAESKELPTTGLPMVISRTKNRCDNCKKFSSLNHIHKTSGVERQFCSNRCRETFRKRVARQKK